MWLLHRSGWCTNVCVDGCVVCVWWFSAQASGAYGSSALSQEVFDLLDANSRVSMMAQQLVVDLRCGDELMLFHSHAV